MSLILSSLSLNMQQFIFFSLLQQTNTDTSTVFNLCINIHRMNVFPAINHTEDDDDTEKKGLLK